VAGGGRRDVLMAPLQVSDYGDLQPKKATFALQIYAYFREHALAPACRPMDKRTLPKYRKVVRIYFHSILPILADFQ